MKTRSVFDITSADTIDDSDSIGAFVRSSDGTLIDHSTINSLEWLNVAAALHDGSGNALSSTGGDLDVNVTNTSIAVTASNLDIRDLTHVSDSVKIGDGTDFLAIDGSGNIGVTDAGGSLTVDAVNLDIRDLTAASDSVASWLKDGSGTSITSTGGALDVNIASSDISIDVQEEANSAIEDTAVAVSRLVLSSVPSWQLVSTCLFRTSVIA